MSADGAERSMNTSPVPPPTFPLSLPPTPSSPRHSMHSLRVFVYPSPSHLGPPRSLGRVHDGRLRAQLWCWPLPYLLQLGLFPLYCHGNHDFRFTSCHHHSHHGCALTLTSSASRWWQWMSAWWPHINPPLGSLWRSWHQRHCHGDIKQKSLTVHTLSLSVVGKGLQEPWWACGRRLCPQLNSICHIKKYF